MGHPSADEADRIDAEDRARPTQLVPEQFGEGPFGTVLRIRNEGDVQCAGPFVHRRADGVIVSELIGESLESARSATSVSRRRASVGPKHGLATPSASPTMTLGKK